MKPSRPHLTAFVCADCEPEDDAYFVAVNALTCPIDFCPRCNGYLSFTEDGKWLGWSEAMLSWIEKQDAERAEEAKP